MIDFHCALRDILQDTSAQVYGVKVATDIHSLLGRLIYLDCPSTGLNAFAESQANTFAELKNQPEETSLQLPSICADFCQKQSHLPTLDVAWISKCMC